MKRNGLLALLISGSILTGCQQIDSISNSTANTFNKGKNAFGDWVEKSSFNEFQQMTNTSIRDKFLFYVNDERDRKVVYLAKPLVASGFNIEKRTTGTIHLVKLVNHEGTFAEANRRINNGIYNSEKEFNGLSLFGVGNGTKIEYVQMYAGSDDGIEFFGGTVNTKYIVSNENEDDQFDWTEGWVYRGEILNPED